jgi:hypothetical protein
MSEESTQTVGVKFRDILDGFDFVNMGSDAAEDDPEESDRYISLPLKNELDLGVRLVMDFAAEVMPDDYDRISDTFRRKGAYGRLKDFLARRGKLEKWYEYQAAAAEAALHVWCEQVGFVVVD